MALSPVELGLGTVNPIDRYVAENARLRAALTEARKWLAVNYEPWVPVFTQIDAALANASGTAEVSAGFDYITRPEPSVGADQSDSQEGGE